MMNTKEIKRPCDSEYSLRDSRTSGYESRGSMETGGRDGYFGKNPCTVLERFRRHSGIHFRVCILLICAWDLYAEPYCGLQYIFAVRMQKSTDTMWSTDRRVGEPRRISSRLLHRSLRIM